MTQVLQMDSNLMCPASDGIAFQQGAVSLLVVPYFSEQGFTLLYVTVFIIRLSLCLSLFQRSLPLLDLHLFSWILQLLFLCFHRNIILLLFLIGLFLRFLLSFCLPLIFLFYLPYNLVNSILVRNTFDICRQRFFLPPDLSSHSRIVHLLHGLIATLLMKQGYLRFILGKYQQSTGTLIKSMQNMNTLKPVLKFQQIFNGVVVVASSSVNYDAWRLVYDQIVIRFLNDIYRQIQDRRLYPNRGMNDLVPIFKYLIRLYLLIVDSDHPIFNSILIVFRRIRLELFHQCGQQFLADPPPLRKGPIDVRVGLHESERVYMNIVGPLLLRLVVLHGCIIIILLFMEEGDKQGDKNSANYSRFLPIANIGRIMKKALPDNAKIAKDAKQTVQECVSEFISFITSEACEKCKNQKRKTINGEDILSSIQVLGFEGYNDILKMYLAKYRESVRANGETVGVDEKEEESEEDEEEDKSEEK